MFKTNSYREKARLILKATRQHARNLATFAAIYKTVMLVLRSTSSTCKEAPLHAFLAGLIGGFLVFGRGIQSSVNQQIVIYVFARAVLSLAKLTMQIPSSRGITTRFNAKMSKHAWPIFASLSWATIMWVFRWYPQTVQPSLRSSMKYMYVFSAPLCSISMTSLGLRRFQNCINVHSRLVMSMQIIGTASVIF